ncbi:MAG: FAD-binding oxidoreductase [Acetobacter sp.]|uniref:NAD(P)/FAD-dependent oxidoreductase n=1 Tax=Acetobacter sp. TaxID=440 RepID=UPI0039ED856E
MSTRADTTPTIVVGAGIIGSAIALELQSRGQDVLLLDRDTPGRGASYGNMASIAVTEFLPTSRPDVWRHIPRWLMDPAGPVSIAPRYAPRLLPWFWRFLRNSRPGTVNALEALGAALCHRAQTDLPPFLKLAGAEDLLSETGCLSLYETEAAFRADSAHLAALDRHGFAYTLLDGPALRQLEPALASTMHKAVLLPANRSIADPFVLTGRILSALLQRGGQIARGHVTDFIRDGRRVSGVRLHDGRVLMGKNVILCAGAYTRDLSRLLGEDIPLETERGYHNQLPSPGVHLAHSLIWPERAFMITPTAGGLRVGGTVEMAGLEAEPDYSRATALLRHARRALPGLQTRGATVWMGHRPALPDTVPILSASARVGGVFYATGHGHLGLTEAATTARVMADLATGAPPPFDIRPFRIDRF